MIRYYNAYFDNGNVASCDKLRLDFKFLNSVDVDTLFSLINKMSLYEYYKNFGMCKYRNLFAFGIGKGDSFIGFTLGVGFNFFSEFDKLNCFIEFNPNKLLGSVCFNDGFFDVFDDTPFGDDYKSLYDSVRGYFRDIYRFIVFHCKYINVKRFDLAYDIPCLRSDVLLVKDRRRYRQIYNSRNNYTEYLGAAQSGGYVKIYNKSLESKLLYDLTRIEITCDSLFYSDFYKRFPRVYITKRVHTSVENIIVALMRNCEASELALVFNRFDRRTKQKYIDLLADEPVVVSEVAFLAVSDVAKSFEAGASAD